MKIKKPLTLVSLYFILAFAAAHADILYNWVYTGGIVGINGNGTLAVDPTPASDGGLTITNFDGIIDGEMITSLASTNTIQGNDNEVFIGQSDPLDLSGIAFYTTNSDLWQIYDAFGNIFAAGTNAGETDVGTFSFSAVPEPNINTMLLLSSVCGLIFFRYRKHLPKKH